MTGLRFHLVLLAVAGLWAVQTWSREAVSAEDRERVLVWEEDTLSVTAVRYASDDRTVEIQRRTEDGESYLWGVEAPPPADAASEYPIGAPGHTLVAGLSNLRAIRELGPAEDLEADVGLGQSTTRIVVETADRRQELAVGDSTFGGEARYVRDESAGVVYVIPTGLVRPFEIGTDAIRERQIHRFAMAEVGIIRSVSGGVERTMVGSTDEWRREGSDEADPVFTNFHRRVEQLAIAGYPQAPPPLEQLEPLLRFEYAEEDGDPLGFVELYRDPSAPGLSYYLRSEQTRVLATAVTTLAERVAQTVGEALRRP